MKTKAINFAKSTSNKSVLEHCKDEWKRRNIKENGSLKANRWAPIYCTRDGKALSVRLVGKALVLFGEMARIEAPQPKLIWED